MSRDLQPLALLLEENLMFAMMVEPQLKRLGYRVRTLPPAQNIPEQAAQEPPALILVNLTTGRCGGPELVRALRGRPELANAPIIGYAGHVEREYFERGRAAGADMVVPNSAIRASLPEVLAKLARARSGEAADDTDQAG